MSEKMNDASLNISMLFASKNKAGSILWQNVIIRGKNKNRYLPVSFVDFINKEMVYYTCQSRDVFKNPEVLCLDNSIPTAYKCLNNIYKRNYNVTKEFYDVMRYFSINTTLVTLSTFCQSMLNSVDNSVVLLPAFPVILAKYCNNTVLIDGIVYRQWTQSNLIPMEEEEKFKRVADSFLNEEEFKAIMTEILTLFPLAYNTVYPLKLWEMVKTNTNTNASLRIRTSLAISWFALHDVFYEPSLECVGIELSEDNRNKVFLDDIEETENFILMEEDY